MSGFDAKVSVVYEFVLKRLVVEQCLRSDNPQAALADWAEALKEQEDFSMEYALSKHLQNEEVRLNAVSGSTAFAEFSKELVEEFELALSIRS